MKNWLAAILLPALPFGYVLIAKATLGILATF